MNFKFNVKVKSLVKMNERLRLSSDTSLLEYEPMLFNQNVNYFNSDLLGDNSRLHNGFEMSQIVGDLSANDSEMSSQSLDTWYKNNLFVFNSGARSLNIGASKYGKFCNAKK